MTKYRNRFSIVAVLTVLLLAIAVAPTWAQGNVQTDPTATHRLTNPNSAPSGAVELGPIVADGGFETGSPNASWDEFSANFGTPLCTVAGCGTGAGTGPHGGTWWVWFGGINAAETGAVTQTLTIPSGTATLTFWLEIPVAANDGFMSVRLDGDEVFRAEETTTGYQTYAQVSVDISTYADGGAHELSFFSQTSAGSDVTNFFIDDVAITAGGGGPTPTPTVSPTPGGGGNTYCSTAPVTIPDNLPAGATSVVTVADSGTISDLNVSLDVTHSWVGDVAITLSHGATTAELYDRPGVPATTFGCSGDNFDVIADDEAATSFEAACQNATPAFPAGGSFIPGDPAGPNLAAFDGANINGTWTLTISDNAAGDTGVLNEWCLITGGGGGPTPTPTATAGNDPDIAVDPASVTETHNTPPQTTNRTLTIDNDGGAALTWTIAEEDGKVLTAKGGEYVAGATGNAPAAQGNNGLTNSGQSGAPYRHTLVPQAGSTTVTHSSTQDIETGNSVSCNSGGLHTDNSYYRVFDLAGDFGINDTFTVNEVSFGVEQATGATGSQPVSVILYTLSGPFVLANLTEIGREDAQVADTAGTVETVTFSPAVAVPANSILVAEIFTPNGQTAGNSFFIGSNTAAQTDPSYLRATDCGVSQPTDTAAIGFPNMHIVLNVTGDVGGGGGACSAPSDIPWLTVSPTNGTTAPGASSNVTLTFNSTGLTQGAHTGNLCIESNDPDEDLVVVPVTLNVGPPTAIDLGSLTQSASGFRIADFAAAGIVVLAGVVLLFRRRK